MTPRQEQVLSALTDKFEHPDRIAARAKISTASPRETASKYCIQLVKLGLAEKGGTPMFPKWRRKCSDTVSEKTRIGYMCLTDYEHELGCADGGSKVYPSIEDLRQHKKCVDECGIVEVEVRSRRVVQQPADQMPDEQ